MDATDLALLHVRSSQDHRGLLWTSRGTTIPHISPLCGRLNFRRSLIAFVSSGNLVLNYSITQTNDFVYVRRRRRQVTPQIIKFRWCQFPIRASTRPFLPLIGYTWKSSQSIPVSSAILLY